MPMERKSVCLGMQGTINKYQSCFSEFNHIDIECKIMNTMRSSIFPVIHLFSEFWFVLRQSYKHFPGLISHFSNTVYNQLINYLFIHHYINQSKTSLSISIYLHIVMFLICVWGFTAITCMTSYLLLSCPQLFELIIFNICIQYRQVNYHNYMLAVKTN